VPVALPDAILGTLDRVVPALAVKAELARLGRYHATGSMLVVLDLATGRYDADATPSTGTATLFDHYARLIAGEAVDERGDHAVFRPPCEARHNRSKRRA
jgi:divinyl chlorophyllide a 8-vinyl-reductase